MKYLFAILISLVPGTISAAAERIYSTGCIPSTPKDWERAGVPLRSPSEELRLRSSMQLSSGAVGVSKSPTKLALDLPKGKSLKDNMYDVQDQGNLGTCSCFSCAAAIEAQLPKGIKISEAELYIRGKTEGGDDRHSEGLSLCKIVSILSNGALLTKDFPDYSTYETYVLNVLNDINGASLSRDCDESIDHFRKYCRDNIPEYKEPTSATVIPPRWKAPSGLLGLWCAFNPAVPTLIQYFGEINDPARRMRIATCAMRIYQKGITLFAQFITDLKLSLLRDIPIVVSVKTFAKFEKVPEGTGSYIKNQEGKYIAVETGGSYNKCRWLTSSQRISGSENLITENYERYGYEHEAYHAICICGYNDVHKPNEDSPGIKAFQFKNSWGSTLGTAGNGYAWLTEAYLENSINEAIVIEVQKGT